MMHTTSWARLLLIVTLASWSTGQCVGLFEGIEYDFRSLSGETFSVAEPPYVYSVRVCSPLPEPYPCDQGACQVRECYFSTSAGQVDTVVHSERLGLFSLTYRDGHSYFGCQRTSTIYLTCNRFAEQAQLVQVDEKEQCTYNYWIETALACPPELPPCTAYSNKGLLHDFRNLSQSSGSEPEFSVESQGVQYDLNICAAVSNTSCPDGTGVCLQSSGSLGVASDYIIPKSPEQFELLYTDGDPLESCEGTAKTLLTLQCAKEATTPQIRVLPANTTCDYEIRVSTEAACPRVPSYCAVMFGDNLIDLSPLTLDPTSSYSFGDHVFNICNPTHACNGSMACSRNATDILFHAGRLIGLGVTGTTNAGLPIIRIDIAMGDLCPVTCDYPRTYRTIIMLTCDPQVDGLEVTSATQAECNTQISASSKHACPAEDPSDPWPSASPSFSASPSLTASSSISNSLTPSISPSLSSSPSNSPTPSASRTHTSSRSATVSPSTSNTPSSTKTISSTPSDSATLSPRSPSSSASRTGSRTPSQSFSILLVPPFAASDFPRPSSFPTTAVGQAIPTASPSVLLRTLVPVAAQPSYQSSGFSSNRIEIPTSTQETITVDIPAKTLMTLPTGVSFDATIVDLPEAQGSSGVVSTVVDLNFASATGETVAFQGDIEICFELKEDHPSEDSCLGYLDEEDKKWVCEDECPKKKEGKMCGTTNHFTSFAILLGTNTRKSRCSEDDLTQRVIEYLSLALGGVALIVILVAACVGEIRIRRKRRMEEMLFMKSERIIESMNSS